MYHVIDAGHGEHPEHVGGSGRECGLDGPLRANDVVLDIACVVMVYGAGLTLDDLPDEVAVGLGEDAVVVGVGEGILDELLCPVGFTEFQIVLDQLQVLVVDLVVTVCISEYSQI